MRIDVADLRAVSDMLRKVVWDYIESLPPDVVSQMRGCRVQWDSDVRIAIEHHLGPVIADPLYEQISSLLEPCEMVCYHATRLTAPECVRATGLKRIHWDWYGKMLLTVMQSVGIAPSDCECAIKLVEREYERKLQLQGHTICFFSGLDLLEDNEQPGYAWFSQNMGGELARWALREKMPQVFVALKQIGIPIVVKFVAPFSAMERWLVEKSPLNMSLFVMRLRNICGDIIILSSLREGWRVIFVSVKSSPGLQDGVHV